MKMATNRFSSGRTRNIDVKHHIVRDTVDQSVVQIKHVKSGGEKHTDTLTKALYFKASEMQDGWRIHVECSCEGINQTSDATSLVRTLGILAYVCFCRADEQGFSAFA